tara:strand:- start:759 stop:1001 length:243 start_codon:yes stop_codon:yes gene_type:complete
MNRVSACLKLAKQTNQLIVVLKKENLVEFFRTYTPSARNGYVFDQNKNIKKIRDLCKDHDHCMSSFSVCCNRVKKMLNQE